MIIVTKGLVFLFLISNIIAAQTVTYESIPSKHQLYPRDEADDDSAIVTIQGIVDGTGYDSVIVDVYRDDVIWKSSGIKLSYNQNDTATFSLIPKIYADLVEFKFDIRIGAADAVVTDSLIDSVVCGDVYLIMGQSNAEAPDFGTFDPYQVEWVRTLGTSATSDDVDDPRSDSLWDIAQAEEIRTHAAVGIWGLGLGKLIAETYEIPVCILNGSRGGRAIYHHLKDPSRELYWNLLWRAEKAGVVDDVKAMIWNQGEDNTKDNGSANEYYRLFPRLRDSLRVDYTNLTKIYTAQINVGWDDDDWDAGGLLREYQRELAEIDAGTEIMTMHDLPGFDGRHYSATGYDSLAFRHFRQIRRDFYGSSEVVDIDPPNISKAYFTDEQKNVLVLEFSNTNTLILQNDTTINSVKRYLKDYFYFHNASNIDSFLVDSIQVFGNLLRLQLNTSSSATKITLYPNRYYNRTTERYLGPWLKSSREIPANSFYEYDIESTFGDDPLPVRLSSFSAGFEKGAIKLKWRTESEVNNLGFIILRKSGSQQEYQQIASYETEHGLMGQGNTSQATNYEFMDTRITAGETYTYLLMDVDYSGNKTNHGPITIAAQEQGAFPQGYHLYQNYPNPFNPSTNIAFFLPQQQHVILRVFDITGKEVEILLDNKIAAGYHEIPFDARNLKSGHYFYEILTAGYHDAGRMLLIK